MREAAKKDFVRLAQTTNGPVAQIVRASIEEGTVFPSLLTTNLKAAGFAINYKTGAEHGMWVAVSADEATEYDSDNPNIVARAFSHTALDALLQAMHAELLEEAGVLDLARKVAANPAAATLFSDTPKGDVLQYTDRELFQRLAVCDANPDLLTRELLVAVASDKPLMARLAAL